MHLDERLKQADFASWIPCTKPLRFSLFDPDKTIRLFYRSRYANFIAPFEVKECEKNARLMRKLCCTGFYFHNVWPIKGKFDGEFRYYMVARTNENRELTGKIIVTDHNNTLPHECEHALLSAYENIDKTYNAFVHERDGKSFSDLVELTTGMDELYEEDIKTQFEALWGKGEEQNTDNLGEYQILLFEFTLLRNGIILFSDKTPPAIQQKAHGFSPVNKSNFLQTPRIYELVYSFMKSCFHEYMLHHVEAASIPGVFNCNRIKQKFHGDRIPSEIFYTYMQNFMSKGITTVKREKNFNKLNPTDIAIYGDVLPPYNCTSFSERLLSLIGCIFLVRILRNINYRSKR